MAAAGLMSQVTNFMTILYRFVFFLFFFVRSNFLKVDVYFASLKQEVVAQEKAYGPLNFLSKSKSTSRNTP